MIRWWNLEAHCRWWQKSSTYLFRFEKFAFVLQDIRYTISEPYFVFWNIVLKYRVEVCDSPYRMPHLNLIRQVHSHGFSAQYFSVLTMLLWTMATSPLQFQLNGKLSDRPVVNCVLHSVRGNEQWPHIRSSLIWNSNWILVYLGSNPLGLNLVSSVLVWQEHVSEALVRSLAWMKHYKCLQCHCQRRTELFSPAKLVSDPKNSVLLETRWWSWQSWQCHWRPAQAQWKEKPEE